MPEATRDWTSLTHMFFAQADALGDRALLGAKREGAWRTWSWTELRDQVVRMARALRAQGLQDGDRVLLVAENRPEWVVADLAIMTAGGITVPAYTTNTVDDHVHLLCDSGAIGAIVSSRDLGERILAAGRRSDRLRFLIAIDPPPVSQSTGPDVQSWDAALATGAAGDDVEASSRAFDGDRVACLIYTSGTGGLPKGVMLTHRSVLANCHGAHHLLRSLDLRETRYLSFLPLSHSYEHTAGLFFALSIGATVYYAEGIDRLTQNLLEIRPTLLTAVPRLCDTMHQRILLAARKAGGIQEWLFNQTLALGRQAQERPGSLSLWQRPLDALVDRLVRRKVRARFGGRLQALVSGGAALNPEVGTFLTALGVPVLQGYGQTEASPVVACNPPERPRMETVGPPLKGVEVRIAEDGEILVRGDLVMKGYWNDPEATARTIVDGWLHTGDVGRIDEDGYIRITDRKKDFIKNSGGDMISPARIEAALTLEPEISQAMVHGDRRPYLVAVVVPDADYLKTWAKEAGAGADLATVADHDGLRRSLATVVGRVNARLPQPERVRQFVVAGEPFSIENSMMTPSLKIRRHVIRETYGPALDRLYEGRGG